MFQLKSYGGVRPTEPGAPSISHTTFNKPASSTASACSETTPVSDCAFGGGVTLMLGAAPSVAIALGPTCSVETIML